MSLITLLLLTVAVGVSYQAATPIYTVEVYFVADRQVINRYLAEQTSGSASVRESNALKSFNDDVDYLLTEVNKLYASLQSHGINIRIAKRKLDVLSTNLFSDNTDATAGLTTFDAWLKFHRSYRNIRYDAAIFWTGYNLHREGNANIAGSAHVGKVCIFSKATGVVEFDLTYHTALVTAHELGHILGATHESELSQYVMVPVNVPRHTNRWSFSLCSAEKFQYLIGNLGPNCLTLTNEPPSVPQADVTAALANPDTVCKRDKDDQNSYMCKAWSLYGGRAPSGDGICKQIWCRKVGTTTCNDAYPSDGMICGRNKRCAKGSCVSHPDSESANADESCLFGDEHQVKFTKTSNGRVTYQAGECRAVLSVLGKHACYYSAVNTKCCGTCAALRTSIPGCPYGDRNPVCKNYRPSQICGRYSHTCCEQCHGYRGGKRIAYSGGTGSSDSNERDSADTDETSGIEISEEDGAFGEDAGEDAEPTDADKKQEEEEEDMDK